MKSILMSIQPKWVEKILNGEKTIEVRKTKPRIDTPFKVYIYCTKGKDLLRSISGWVANTDERLTSYRINNDKFCTNEIANGKVVAEFICDSVEYIPNIYYNDMELEEITKNTCLSPSELYEYMGDSIGCYKWNISNLKIYDELKDIKDFHNFKQVDGYWIAHPLKKAPQSWCNIWENKDE